MQFHSHDGYNHTTYHRTGGFNTLCKRMVISAISIYDLRKENAVQFKALENKYNQVVEAYLGMKKFPKESTIHVYCEIQQTFPETLKELGYMTAAII